MVVRPFRQRGDVGPDQKLIAASAKKSVIRGGAADRAAEQRRPQETVVVVEAKLPDEGERTQGVPACGVQTHPR